MSWRGQIALPRRASICQLLALWNLRPVFFWLNAGIQHKGPFYALGSIPMFCQLFQIAFYPWIRPLLNAAPDSMFPTHAQTGMR